MGAPDSSFHLSLLSLLIIGYFLQGTEANCPRGWTLIEKNCYGIFNNPQSWSDAELDCQSYGKKGHLVSILNRKEMDALATYLKFNLKQEEHVWIGLHDPRTGDNKNVQWTWTDLSPVTFSSWAAGEPNNGRGGTEYCAELYTKGYTQWNDDVCETQHPYLCKYSL